MGEDSQKPGNLDPKRAKDMEEELNATLRRQVERLLPVPLPFSDFWGRSAELLDYLEGELNRTVRAEGHNLRSHTASRRKANVRRTLTELARKRLVALLNHAVSSDFRPEGGADPTGIPSLDWNKHDAAEKQFYNQCVRLVESFKSSVNWVEMQSGAGSVQHIPQVSQGTKQLDDFVEEPGGLTGRGPPPIEIIMQQEAEIEDFEEDEEERIARMEAFPEMMEMANQSLPPEDRPPIDDTPVFVPEKKSTMTLDDLVSTGATQKVEIEPLEEEVQIQESPSVIENRSSKGSVELLRIRILQSSDEPIATADGEIDLEAGDVHQLEQKIADYLIQAGVAEAAPL